MGVWVTTKQAAHILGINQSRVRQLILSGRLPAKKFGHIWTINENDLELVKKRAPGRPIKK